MKLPNFNNKGFTLIETIIVILLISAFIGTMIIFINPPKHLADARNSQRKGDINTILSAVYQYSVDNKGEFPQTITNKKTEICMTGGDCTGLVDLSILTEEEYLEMIPFDPLHHNENGTGYKIMKLEEGSVRITAPNAERGETIKVTK